MRTISRASQAVFPAVGVSRPSGCPGQALLLETQTPDGGRVGEGLLGGVCCHWEQLPMGASVGGFGEAGPTGGSEGRGLEANSRFLGTSVRPSDGSPWLG